MGEERVSPAGSSSRRGRRGRACCARVSPAPSCQERRPRPQMLPWQAATFCLVATAKWSGFLEAHAGPVIVSRNRVYPIRRFCKRAVVQGVTYALAASIVTVSRCGKGSPSAQRCTYSVPITGGLPLASS